MPIELSDILSTIRFVLVNTTLPANIGSAARAMHTMGLSNLVLVAPKHPIDATSHSHAKGGVHLLDNACLVDTIEDAIADCHLVFAASSRSRAVPRPVLNPSVAAYVMMQVYQELTDVQGVSKPKLEVSQKVRKNNITGEPNSETLFLGDGDGDGSGSGSGSGNNNGIAEQSIAHVPTSLAKPIDLPKSTALPQKEASLPKFAVLFGREDRGLTNDELALADYHIQIDANPSYPVLNVAAAVQVIASFFYAQFLMQVQKTQTQTTQMQNEGNLSNKNKENQPRAQKTINQVELTLRQSWDEPPATCEQTQKLQAQLIDLMHTLDLTNSADPAKLRELPSRLSRLESRLQLDQKECEILTAIVAKLCRRLNT